MGIYQLKISLDDSEPEIWRRILIRDDATFGDLHFNVQVAMGWKNLHAYAFRAKGLVIEEPDERFEPADPEITQRQTIEPENITLKEYFKRVRSSIKYEYDFGDSWEHTITLEKVISVDGELPATVCIAGEMKTPPEDCGGIPGYYDILEILKNKKHPEHESTKEWLEIDDIDPTEFNLEETNDNLTLMNASKEHPDAYFLLDSIYGGFDDDENDDDDDDDDDENPGLRLI